MGGGTETFHKKMFKSCLAVACSSIFGFELSSLPLERHFDPIFRAGIGSCVGVILSSWIFFITTLKIPLSLSHAFIHYLILLCISALIHIYRLLRRKKRVHFKLFKPITYFFSVIIPFFIVSYFIKTGLLPDGYNTKGAAYGDFPFHMNIINSFVYGCNMHRKSLFDLKTPFYANEKLAYPIIPDYYSAVLISCFGANISEAARIPSYVFVAGLFIVLSNIAYQFSNSELVCCIAPYLFIFTGGTGFTQWFDKEARNSYMIDYVHHWSNDRHEYWFNTIIHILLPQRLSLFSLPIAWGVIAILMKCNYGLNVSGFVFAGFLVALLAQVQTHSIIALFEWGVSFAIITFPFAKPKKWNSYIINYLSLGVVAIAIGFPQCIQFLGRAKEKFFRFCPLYKEIEGRNFITLWWYGLGAFIVLALIHGPIILNKKQLQFYGPSLIVFIISNFIWYQPWGLDNTKVFNATFIPLACVCVANFIAMIYKTGIIGHILSAMLLFFCTISGFMCIWKGSYTEFSVWHPYENPYGIAEFVRKNTDPDGVWITDQGHTHPVLTLAGRQTLVGYRGWVGSHNLNDFERMQAISALQWDPNNVELTDKYNVSYIGIRYDSNDVTFNPDLSLGNWKIIYESPQFKVYQRNK